MEERREGGKEGEERREGKRERRGKRPRRRKKARGGRLWEGIVTKKEWKRENEKAADLGLALSRHRLPQQRRHGLQEMGLQRGKYSSDLWLYSTLLLLSRLQPR